MIIIAGGGGRGISTAYADTSCTDRSGRTLENCRRGAAPLLTAAPPVRRSTRNGSEKQPQWGTHVQTEERDREKHTQNIVFVGLEREASICIRTSASTLTSSFAFLARNCVLR